MTLSSDRRVLVTGSAGMVGSHLSEMLAADKDNLVIATYHRPTIDLAELPASERVKVCELDVTHGEVVRRMIVTERPDEIFHLAAQSLPAVSWANPWDTIQVNVLGTVNLFEAIKSVRATDPSYDPVVVVACSSAAYGASLRPDNVPITETNILQPLHPYGISKAAQDMLTYQYRVNDGIRGIRARIFNSTGPRKTRDVVSDFAARVAKIATTGSGSLRVGNLEARRAILDVRDLTAALVLLARKGVPGEAYNICATRAYLIRDLLSLFEAAAGIAIATETDPGLYRPSDEPIIFGDTSKLRNVTGWSPVFTIQQTIQSVVDYELRALRIRALQAEVPASLA